MEYGVHLHTQSLDGKAPSLDYLFNEVNEADQLGYTYLAMNDHFGSSRSLLDPITTLAAVASASGRLRLVPSVMLVMLRGIIPSAKYLATLDVLTGGRVIAGIGPGSQEHEYDMVGLNYKERWPRFNEATMALRSLLDPDRVPFKGSYYSTEGITFEPRPVQQPSMPILIGSWGSNAGLRRVARLSDGWLGSALESTPERFKVAKQRLDAFLEHEGKDPAAFPNAVSTMTLYVSDSKADLDRVPLGPQHYVEPDAPHERTMVGSRNECIEKLHRWKDSGAQALFLRPFEDGPNQMRLFKEQVAARV